MKKQFAIGFLAASSLSMALASAVYAQSSSAPPAPSTPPPPASGAPAPAPTPSMPPPTTAPGSAAPGAKATPERPKETLTGWSVKDKIMGKTVYNEKNEKVGEVEDVVLATDGKASYFLVGAGGFLGMGKHDVAIPFNTVTQMDDKLVLQGYTKEKLKAMPEVELVK